MRLTLCKLCSFADRLSSGNPVIFGIFSRMSSGTGFPARLDPCYLVVEIEAEPIETGSAVPMEIRLLDEDGRILTAWGGDLEFMPSYEAIPSRTFIQLQLPWDQHFVFNQAGTFRFDVVLRPETEDEQVLGGETLIVHAGPPKP